MLVISKSQNLQIYFSVVSLFQAKTAIFLGFQIDIQLNFKNLSRPEIRRLSFSCLWDFFCNL